MTFKTLTTDDVNSVLESLDHSSEEIATFRRLQPALATTIDAIADTAKKGNTSPQGWAMLIANLTYKAAEQASATTETA